MNEHHIVNDASQRNPVRVLAVVAPACIEDVQQAVRRTTGPISIAGARLSMGGQAASPDSLHLDMRAMNRVLAFSPQHKSIRVQAGARWRDVQSFIDPHGLALKVTQSYADFTVGGSLAANAHGREVGAAPLVQAVRSVKLVLHDGSLVEADRVQRPELFFGAIGSFGALGIIVEAELDLAENHRIRRDEAVMPLAQYRAYFRGAVRNDPDAVFHEAVLQAPQWRTVCAVTWRRTDETATFDERLRSVAHAYPLRQYARWSGLDSRLGALRRGRPLGSLVPRRKTVHWRNYEAGADVLELEPPSREQFSYVLQEYCVPVAKLEEFVERLRSVLHRHRVDAVEVSIRHVMPDDQTLLNWAAVESFVIVLEHRYRVRQAIDRRIGVWTRELTEAALAVQGTYRLPYQQHATAEQFHRAYPRAMRLFELKKRLDPACRFTNALWDRFYAPWLAGERPRAERPTAGGFVQLFDDTGLSDDFYRFLQRSFAPLPEDRLHLLIDETCRQHRGEEGLYRHVQHQLRTAKSLGAHRLGAEPASREPAAELADQVLQLLGDRTRIDGYAEIGSAGRYLSGLSGSIAIAGSVFAVDDAAPRQPALERVRSRLRGQARVHVPLAGYAALGEAAIASDSLDLVACLDGLHHVPPARLAPFLQSVRRVLRVGGMLIVRDHDVADERTRLLVSLAHTVSNAVRGQPWEIHAQQPRYFTHADEWAARLATVGLKDSGHRLALPDDPTGNVLMAFVKLPIEADRRASPRASRQGAADSAAQHAERAHDWAPPRLLQALQSGSEPTR